MSKSYAPLGRSLFVFLFGRLAMPLVSAIGLRPFSAPVIEECEMTEQHSDFIKNNSHKCAQQTANLNLRVCSYVPQLSQRSHYAFTLIKNITAHLISNGNNNPFAQVKRVSKNITGGEIY